MAMTNATKSHQKRIVLVGNPNVGKSIFFHYLSNIYVDVSNYPGTTVEVTSVHIAENILQDTPGIYGVSSFNDEERVARDIILYADEIINVVSAISLERDLFLTKQLIDMGKPMIVALNQMDEAKSAGLEIDIKKLSDLLGAPVFPTVAITGEGMNEIKQAVFYKSKGETGKIDPVLQNELTELLPHVSNQAEALLILEGDLLIAERNKVLPKNKRTEIYSTRRKEVNEIIYNIISKKDRKERFLTKISNYLTHPFWGSVFAVLIAFLFLYQFLGVVVGGNLISFTEKKIMNAYYEPQMREFTGLLFPVEVSIEKDNKKIIYSFPKGFLQEKEKYNSLKKLRNNSSNLKEEYFFSTSDYIEETKNAPSSSLPLNLHSAIGTILSGKYGILTLTITYLLGLLLPLVAAFYTALAILEDSGYLPRLAVLVDGLLSKLGMNGRAIIPLILGLGCVTMASVTTRLLSSRREKLIVMAILGFAIPCSAQLGVIQSLLVKNGGISSWIVWFSVIMLVLLITGFVMNKFLPGKSTPLLLDLPPLRMPRIQNVFYKARTKIMFFMAEAVPVFFLASFVVGIMQVTNLLNKVILLFEPICSNFLRLPKEVSISFILGMVRRDFGAFGLTELDMTSAQVTVASIVLTLFVPCIAAVSVMAKEQNWRVALGIWLSSMILAIIIGGLIARILNT